MQKLSLNIGCNYPGTTAELQGCVNDANDWAKALEARGFRPTLRHDADASREALLKDLNASIAGLKAKDTLVITFSGHGTYVTDLDGDESDQRDECLVTADLNIISDDDLYEAFSQRKRGSRVIFLSDSCHSGTVARFNPPLPGSDHKPEAPRGRVRFLPPQNLAALRDKRGGTKGFAPKATYPSAHTQDPHPGQRVRRLVSSAALLSGCKDSEYSYDAYFSGRYNGAFTKAALDVLQTVPAGEPLPLRKLHNAVRAALPNADYPQSPQLTATSDQKAWTL